MIKIAHKAFFLLALIHYSTTHAIAPVKPATSCHRLPLYTHNKMQELKKIPVYKQTELLPSRPLFPRFFTALSDKLQQQKKHIAIPATRQDYTPNATPIHFFKTKPELPQRPLPLHSAVLEQGPDAIKEHLRKGAYINQQDNRGLTPLHVAAKQGNNDAIKLLLSHDCPAQQQSQTFAPQPCSAQSFIGSCCRPYTSGMRQLISCKADTNSTDNKGRTPLHLAAKYGNLDACKLLLWHGADRMLLDGNSRSALDYAILKNHEDITKLLMS
ncbi:MAG: ankyrin repeat domain-containing protein [Epsilonproteobacteria bacterium]|nr:ankyrin repeat domain-containing protein [Campylobacterota bacterium]